MNPMQMRAQHKWLWDHAVYLFLGGLSGGAYLVGAVAGFLGPAWNEIYKIGIALAFPTGIVAVIVLNINLGRPMKAIHSWKRPQTSWISRGVMIWSVFLPVAFIHLAGGIWPYTELNAYPGIVRLLTIVGILSSFGTAIYTGFLLNVSRPIAFWSTGILPMLFLVSGLVSGLFAVLTAAGFLGVAAAGPLATMGNLGVVLVVILGMVLSFHLHECHRLPEGRAAAELLLKGSGAMLFWFGVVILGILVPFILLIGGILGGTTQPTIAAITGIVGNLALRQAVLKGGVFARLRAGRFEYVVTNP